MLPCINKAFLLRYFMEKLCEDMNINEAIEQACNTRHEIFCEVNETLGTSRAVRLVNYSMRRNLLRLKCIFLVLSLPWWRPWVLICLFILVVVFTFYKILRSIEYTELEIQNLKPMGPIRNSHLAGLSKRKECLLSAHRRHSLQVATSNAVPQ